MQFLLFFFFTSKVGKNNCYSFYISLKSSFLLNKAYISCLLLIVIGVLECLKYIHVFISITRFRHNKNQAKD